MKLALVSGVASMLVLGLADWRDGRAHRANDVLRRAEELRLEEGRLLARIRRFGSYTAAARLQPWTVR